MNVLQEIEITRAKIMRETDAAFQQLVDQLIRSGALGRPEDEGNPDSSTIHYETVYPISMGPTMFKGKKPTGVLFGENDRVNVGTWKAVFKAILERCNHDPEKHVALMNLRGKISGRDRVLLSSQPDSMRSPLQIDDNLYVETHYDTETLLRILTTRILHAVGYDYHFISVAIRNDQSS